MPCSHPRSPAPLFHLAAPVLACMGDTFAAQIEAGLRVDGGAIAALPAWLPRPVAGLAGRALVLDLGGTNLRAALVELHPSGGLRVLEGPAFGEVPGVGDPSVGAEAFFDAQAALLTSLGPPAGVPLGYVFSFPARVQPDGDAVLLRWTKELRVPGVEGRPVGALLRAALARRGLAVGALRVLNDTVAALLAGARQPVGATEAAQVVGLVVGTGTNMAAFYPATSVPKLGLPPGSPALAVNLESGNLAPTEINGWDLALDMETDNPGLQAFEKAVSGRYLPRLLALAAEDPALCSPVEGAAALVRLRAAGGAHAELAGAILDRSADLVACGLAAVFAGLPPGPALVAAEGGLFWRAPGYAARVEERLAALLGGTRPLRIAGIEDANLEGAAAAALGPGWGAP